MGWLVAGRQHAGVDTETPVVVIRGCGHQAVVAGRVGLSHLDGDPHTQPLVERIANREVDIDLPVVPLPSCAKTRPF